MSDPTVTLTEPFPRKGRLGDRAKRRSEGQSRRLKSELDGDPVNCSAILHPRPTCRAGRMQGLPYQSSLKKSGAAPRKRFGGRIRV